MASQFGRAPLASPPFTDLVNGAALTRLLLQAPRNVRLDGTLSRSLAGARVPSSVRRRAPFAMGEDVAGTAFPFAAARGHLPDILVVENGGPRLVEPDEAPSTTVAPETVVITVLKKLGLKASTR